MKTIFKHFLLLAILATVSVSCLKSDPFICRSLVMGYISNGVMTVDGGLTFYIQKSNVEIKAKPEERVVAVCDVLETVENSNTEYKVNLINYAVPLLKEPLRSSSIADEDEIGHDPVVPVQHWFAGGFYNVYLSYYYLVSSETKHEINLVYDELRSNSDTLYFTLRHNAKNEAPGYDGINVSDLAQGYSYATFPIKEIVGEGSESVAIAITGEWYRQNSSFSNPTTESYKYVGTYTRESE